MEREIDKQIGAAFTVKLGAVPVCRGEKRAGSKGEALDLHSYPSLWLRSLGHDQGNEIAATSNQN